MNIVSCNRQRVVNLVAARLRNGKGRAWSDQHNMCMYRTPSGNACAVGALMHDGEEPEALNMQGAVDRLFSNHPHLYGYWWAQDRKLLIALQGVHDNPDLWADTRFIGEHALKAVCDAHGLSYPQP